ncbi:MAG: type IV toxin-antitoxin system AbiEi family antitoxin domain-containing protein [Candidatus Cryosericum sp.]
MDTHTQEALAALPVVTKQNLGVLLGVPPATLNYRVRRMQTTGELLALRSGLYVPAAAWRSAQVGPDQAKRYLEYLSGIVRSPSYVSLEYVLERAGLIPESPFAVTCITTKTPRTYETPLGRFLYRSIRTDLFTGYVTLSYRGLETRIASPAKALFDMLYLRPFTTAAVMRAYLLESGRFNWEALRPAEKKKFVVLVQASDISKMKRILSILTEEAIL